MSHVVLWLIAVIVWMLPQELFQVKVLLVFTQLMILALVVTRRT